MPGEEEDALVEMPEELRHLDWQSLYFRPSEDPMEERTFSGALL